MSFYHAIPLLPVAISVNVIEFPRKFAEHEMDLGLRLIAVGQNLREGQAIRLYSPG